MRHTAQSAGHIASIESSDASKTENGNTKDSAFPRPKAASTSTVAIIVTRVANSANMARALFIGRTSLVHSIGAAWSTATPIAVLPVSQRETVSGVVPTWAAKSAPDQPRNLRRNRIGHG